jgi:multiple antibiotic resistance protein
MLALFLNVYLKMFVILTPFFVLSAFLSLTAQHDRIERKHVAVKVTAAVGVLCFSLYLFGHYLFDLFGITLDAFRIGAGAVLFLSAISMIQGMPTAPRGREHDDMAVVPLAIPITVGPGTIGALMVMGAGLATVAERAVASLALLCAVLTVGLVLAMASWLDRLLGQQGLVILTKLTGLFVSAIAAQIVFTGIRNFLLIGS